MDFDINKLEEALVGRNYVSVEDIRKAEKFVKAKKGTFVEYLLANNLLTKDLLGQAIAESFGVSYADLNSNQPRREQVLKIPEKVATKYQAVLFTETPTKVIVTTSLPTEPKLFSELAKIFPTKQIAITYSLTEDIDASFVHYRKPLETRFAKIIAESRKVAPEILEEIFADAYTYHSSDIHFEPQKEEVLVRFRIDGVLQEAGRIPKEYYENILNRVKTQSHMPIDEHFSALDGSMRHQIGNKMLDMRVSIMPTVEGEKIVLRLLASYIQSLNLSDLGLSFPDQEIMEEAAGKPFGMILVTGPTGSGKTTTLYSLMKILQRPEVNITTIEDPVEYKIVGANQVQVNKQTDLTFAKGLRSIVRQDPDIILVGEVRDNETAEIAVNAALTGHLLLSTFHANDAATSIPRLLDMGVEPFLLASTLEVVVAQRLVRQICESCKYSVTMTKKEMKDQSAGMEKYFSGDKIRTYKGKGCSVCGHTGYHGRTGIFEFVRITPEMKELILTNPSTGEVWKLATKQGARSLFEDGIEKVKAGVTTMEELLRVAKPPEPLSKSKK